MSYFVSKREKRLWLYTLLVIIGIYSTLGVAQIWAEKLQGFGLDVILFLAGCFMVALTVVTQSLKVKPSGLEISVILGITTAYFMVFSRMAIPTERSHIIEYGIVAIFIYEALLERSANGKKVLWPGVMAILLTALIGVFDECLQAIIPNRVFDTEDMLFNTIAAIMAVGSSFILSWIRKKIK